MIKYALIISVFLLLPIFTHAQIIITEIMYSLEGADDKHEWIEVFNAGSEDIDLTSWRFNDGSNHKLNIPPEKGGQGSIVLGAGEYAILTGNAETFLTDHSGFGGTVIDTVMSLNNTGDTVSMIDGSGVTVDSVTYTAELGADGDGNSLQLISGNWSAIVPTLGVQNEDVNSSSDEQNEDSLPGEEEQQSQSSSSSNQPSSISSFSAPQQIFASAGNDRNVVVGADTLFEGKSLGLQKKPLEHARYVWNFGNGETKEGQNVLHYYQYPGEYVVVLHISSGEYSASDRIIVNAFPAELVISKIETDFIEIQNNSEYEINLSWWQLESQGTRFMIPKDTIILPNKKLLFSSTVTNLDTREKDNVSLLYPNGITANLFTQMKIPQKTITKKQDVAKPRPVQHIESTQRTDTKAKISEEKEVSTVTPTKNVEEEPLKNSNYTATAISSFGNKGEENTVYKWLLALISIIGISVGVLVFNRKSKKGDEIEIVE